MLETTLTGARLESAKNAYDEYAKRMDKDPMCFAFFEGVQWADQNPICGWSKIEDSDECLALISSYIHKFGFVAVAHNTGVADITDNINYVQLYEYWMPMPSLPKE